MPLGGRPVATVPDYQPDSRFNDPRFRLCFARLVTHYRANAGFRKDGELQERARLLGDLLGDLPGVLIHGKLDLSSPLDIPWQLAQVWPGAELVVIGDEGHHGGDAMTAATIAATDRFAANRRA